MEINFEFEWWKILFIGLEISTMIVGSLFGGIIVGVIGYLFVGFLICYMSGFVLPRLLFTWAIEFWKDDIYSPFISK